MAAVTSNSKPKPNILVLIHPLSNLFFTSYPSAVCPFFRVVCEMIGFPPTPSPTAKTRTNKYPSPLRSVL